MSIEARVFRDTLGHFCSGVVIATGQLDGVPAGFAAQSFTSLSLDPPLVALCPGKSSSSWPKLREAGHFCINVLGADQQAICRQFAESGADKFAGIDWRPGISGAPILAGVLAYIDCRLEHEHDGGDHTLAIGRVLDLAVLTPEPRPLLFFRGGYGTFEEFST